MCRLHIFRAFWDFWGAISIRRSIIGNPCHSGSGSECCHSPLPSLLLLFFWKKKAFGKGTAVPKPSMLILFFLLQVSKKCALLWADKVITQGLPLELFYSHRNSKWNSKLLSEEPFHNYSVMCWTLGNVVFIEISLSIGCVPRIVLTATISV